MIRKILLASAGAMALAGSAFAADLPSRAPPPVYVPPPPPPAWTGFYVGINAGYEWAASKSVTTEGAPIFANPAFPLGSSSIASALAIVGTTNLPVNQNGFIGGGQAGYNYQFASSWVVGLEADFQGVATSNNTSHGFSVIGVPNFPAESYTAGVSDNKKVDYLGTVRGRFGFLFTPTLLVFGDGGLAYGGINSSSSFIASESLGPATYPTVGGFGGISNTKVGWTAGGGVEWLFLPNWSAKVEYLYYDLGTASSNLLLTQTNLAFAGAPWGTAGVHTSTRFNGNVVRVGLNYHFNWGAPAPVVAKY
jgi:outer membrane immunogenic protein